MANSYTQVPPNSTGNKMRTNSRVVGADTVHEQAVYTADNPTYYALADTVAFAQNKHMISIFNAAGSGKHISIKSLNLINLSLAAVTGVAVRQDIKRISAHSGGTVVTPNTMDSENPAIPAQIDVRTGATSVTEGVILMPLTFTNDEVGVTQAFPTNALLQVNQLIRAQAGLQEIHLREGEGLTVKNITSTVVGSFAYLLVFTMEDNS